MTLVGQTMARYVKMVTERRIGPIKAERIERLISWLWGRFLKRLDRELNLEEEEKTMTERDAEYLSDLRSARVRLTGTDIVSRCFQIMAGGGNGVGGGRRNNRQG